MDFSKVLESTKEPYFIVKHKLLCVSRGDYEEALKSYLNPYSEEGVQEFVSKYLASQGDPGIVGLVGIERRKDQVLIDAAVRYSGKGDKS
ncbi:MAG: hypothetical protein ACOWWO_06195 [Peptococcaceae bacterium]